MILAPPLFFRESLRTQVIQSLSPSSDLDTIIEDFMDRYNLFSINTKFCKISKLESPKENFFRSLSRGIELNCYMYPSEYIYEFKVPIPLFKLSTYEQIDNSPAIRFQSKSICNLDVTSQELCEISTTLGNSPIHFTHILPKDSKKKGRKMYFYIDKGQIEYEAHSHF